MKSRLDSRTFRSLGIDIFAFTYANYYLVVPAEWVIVVYYNATNNETYKPNDENTETLK